MIDIQTRESSSATITDSRNTDVEEESSFVRYGKESMQPGIVPTEKETSMVKKKDLPVRGQYTKSK